MNNKTDVLKNIIKTSRQILRTTDIDLMGKATNLENKLTMEAAVSKKLNKKYYYNRTIINCTRSFVIFSTFVVSTFVEHC